MTAGAPVLALAGVTGLALGSYAVTAGLRYSRAEPSSAGRSQCDACGETLGFLRTVPIVSYLRAGGACTTCRARIDPLHLVGEAAGLAAVAMAATRFDLLRTPLLAALGLVLITASTIDWKIGRLPDRLTGAAAILGALLAGSRSGDALVVGVVAALVAFVLLEGLRRVRMRVGRDPGLGFGDVKLVCALALWLGLATPWMIVGAAGAGLGMMFLVRPAAGRLAFGPALAVAGWLVGMGGEWGLWPTTA